MHRFVPLATNNTPHKPLLLHGHQMQHMTCTRLCANQVAREEVATLIKADPADVVPVVNATAAVNTIVASTHLQAGDLILMTNVTYNAVR